VGSSSVSLAESSASWTWAEFLCPTCEPSHLPKRGFPCGGNLAASLFQSSAQARSARLPNCVCERCSPPAF